MEPGVVATGTKDERIEFGGGVRAEDGGVQFTGTIFLFKDEAESVLGTFFRTAVPSAMNADAALDIEDRCSVAADEFSAGGTFPIVAAFHGVGVDAAFCAEEIFVGSGDEKTWERIEGGRDAFAAGRIVGDFGVHFVVGDDWRVAASAPGFREDCAVLF